MPDYSYVWAEMPMYSYARAEVPVVPKYSYVWAEMPEYSCAQAEVHMVCVFICPGRGSHVFTCPGRVPRVFTCPGRGTRGAHVFIFPGRGARVFTWPLSFRVLFRCKIRQIWQRCVSLEALRFCPTILYDLASARCSSLSFHAA